MTKNEIRREAHRLKGTIEKQPRVRKFHGRRVILEDGHDAHRLWGQIEWYDRHWNPDHPRRAHTLHERDQTGDLGALTQIVIGKATGSKTCRMMNADVNGAKRRVDTS